MRLLVLGILGVSAVHASIDVYLQEKFNAPDVAISKKQHGPWLTGPLLTASPGVVPAGHYNFEPYLFVNNTNGAFNNHWQMHRLHHVDSNINFQFFTQLGLTKWMDMFITPQFFYNYNQDQSHWRFGDLLMGADFQLYVVNKQKHLPSVKFTISELFPTGAYQHLHAGNLGTDGAGGGSFATTFQFVFGYNWHFYTVHFLAMRWSAAAVLFTPVGVHGINTYGGDPTTNGRVMPGTSFPVLFGFEYTMTENWALALDINSTFTCQTRFKGHTIAPVGTPTWSYSLSFAPAIEYNFNANVGLIGGVWLTAIGRTSANFINYVVALNWYV